jgi:hypothetical protein
MKRNRKRCLGLAGTMKCEKVQFEMKDKVLEDVRLSYTLQSNWLGLRILEGEIVAAEVLD